MITWVWFRIRHEYIRRFIKRLGVLTIIRTYVLYPMYLWNHYKKILSFVQSIFTGMCTNTRYFLNVEIMSNYFKCVFYLTWHDYPSWCREKVMVYYFKKKIIKHLNHLSPKVKFYFSLSFRSWIMENISPNFKTSARS